MCSMQKTLQLWLNLHCVSVLVDCRSSGSAVCSNFAKSESQTGSPLACLSPLYKPTDARGHGLSNYLGAVPSCQ